MNLARGTRAIIPALTATCVLAAMFPFQNCSHDPRGISRGGELSDAPESVKSSYVLQDGGMPFDGKLATYQSYDGNYCARISSHSTGLRHEVTRDRKGYWISVENCLSVPARRIDEEVLEVTPEGIRIKEHILPQVQIVDRNVHTRIRCYVSTTDHLAVKVYESENGLKMHYPRKFEAPDFIPVSATRQSGLKGVFRNRPYVTTYSSAFWNEVYSGQFILWLNSDGPGRVQGQWLLQLDNGQSFRKVGVCEVKKSIYPW